MLKELIYESPVVDVCDVMAEGVLCVSGDDSGMDMNPEDGNM